MPRRKIRAQPSRPFARAACGYSKDCIEINEIAWRISHAGIPPTPMVDSPLTHPEGRLPLTRDNAGLYVRSIIETFFAGQSGQDAWDTLFGKDGDVSIRIEITAPAEMAGQYEVGLRRRIILGYARPFRGPEEQPDVSVALPPRTIIGEPRR